MDGNRKTTSDVEKEVIYLTVKRPNFCHFSASNLNNFFVLQHRIMVVVLKAVLAHGLSESLRAQFPKYARVHLIFKNVAG